MTQKTLEQIVAENPFDDFQAWWPVGAEFMTFMSNAIVPEWRALPGNDGSLNRVREYLDLFIRVVFKRETRDGLLDDFVNNTPADYQSGEFDALSYAFYRAAFEVIAANIDQYDEPLEVERRRFTVRVGAHFYQQLHDHLQLDLPAQLDSDADYAQLDAQIQKVGAFLEKQGYLRDHFAFKFDVKGKHGNAEIAQAAPEFLAVLASKGTAHALYEMGYPIILPSAVYLYHTIGEAQHHSSRTIEELFKRVGYRAYEVDDFDPIAYPSDMVVELWEIEKLAE